MMNETCNDNRFKLIEKAKKDLLENTNIDTNFDELKVLDNFLFRCWQMSWLERYDDETCNDNQKVEEFGYSVEEIIDKLYELHADLVSVSESIDDLEEAQLCNVVKKLHQYTIDLGFIGDTLAEMTQELERFK